MKSLYKDALDKMREEYQALMQSAKQLRDLMDALTAYAKRTDGIEIPAPPESPTLDGVLMPSRAQLQASIALDAARFKGMDPVKAAIDLLNETHVPMSGQDIVKELNEGGLSLSKEDGRVLREKIRKNAHRFQSVEPGVYGLKEWYSNSPKPQNGTIFMK